jgi:hypothetical protein
MSSSAVAAKAGQKNFCELQARLPVRLPVTLPRPGVPLPRSGGGTPLPPPPDWRGLVEGIRKLTSFGKSVDVSEKPGCKLDELASSYLANLKKDGIDRVVASIPPRKLQWDLPSGDAVTVRQQWSKYGLALDVEIKGPDGAPKHFGASTVPKAKLTEKGVSWKAFEHPLTVDGRYAGEVSMDLRVGLKDGVNEVGLTYEDAQGNKHTYKLKPGKPCDLDFSKQEALRFNTGHPAAAREVAEEFLAASAMAHGGNLTPGLYDLLMHIRPDVKGKYRNHGSEALSSLTRPLNALRGAGADFAPLEAAQRRGDRPAAVRWFKSELFGAIERGRIEASAVANSYGLNLGVPQLAGLDAADGEALVPNSTAGTRVQPNQVMLRTLAIELNSVGVNAIQQTRDGRIFIPVTPASPRFTPALAVIAKNLGIDAAVLRSFEARLTLPTDRGPRQFEGVVVEPRSHPAD